MKVIISGAGGFLGNALLQRMKEKTAIEVYALTSQVEQMRLRFPECQNINICSKNSVQNREIPITSDTVLLNCAFPRNAKGEQFALGLNYVSQLLQSAVIQGVGAVINISSQSIYDQKRDRAAAETDNAHLDSVYAVGKYASELLTEAICFNRPYTNVRLASLIGPQFNQRVINKLVECAFKTGKLYIRNGEQQFGFLDIEDAVNGIINILDVKTYVWKPVYNLGGNRTYSLLDMAEIIVAIFKKEYGKQLKIEIETDDTKLNTALDCSLLQKDTGYMQQITMEQSVYRIIKNYECEYGV